MKITFIAEHGVEVESRQIGPDYRTAQELVAAATAEHDRMWDPDSAAGYDRVLAQNRRKLSRWQGACTFVSWLVVPFGYLVLTR